MCAARRSVSRAVRIEQHRRARSLSPDFTVISVYHGDVDSLRLSSSFQLSAVSELAWSAPVREGKSPRGSCHGVAQGVSLMSPRLASWHYCERKPHAGALSISGSLA